MLNGSLPGFGLDAGQLLVAAARATAVIGLLGAFGTLLLEATTARPVLAHMRDGRRATGRIAWGSLVLALLGLIAWIGAQSALLEGTETVGGLVSAVFAVLPSTAFGRLASLQLAAIACAAVALGTGQRRLAAAAAGFGLALQAGHLHAWAMQPGPSALLICEGLHVLAAGSWIGALPALAKLVRAASDADAFALSGRFSRVASGAVAVIVGTAAFQGFILSGGWPGLVGTAYGWMELAKALLLCGMLGFAAANRFRFTPALAGPHPSPAKRTLARSIAGETALGLLVVLAASVLTGLEPGMHAQPVWPFAKQPSLMVVQADPDFRREVADAVLALLGALALLGLGVAVRWLRLVAWLAALAIAWFAVPHLDLLFVDAYPTSFYRSPTRFAAASIAEGAALYPEHCAACHGAAGTGDGPAAKGLHLPPADLTADHLWAHSDGEMFWWLTHGIVSPEGEIAMPGFADMLGENERWALIDYVRAHNAGLTFRRTGGWSPPVPAPNLDATCPDGHAVSLDDLRGQVARIGFGDGTVTMEPAASGATVCRTADPAALAAYAIVTGRDADALRGAQALVDANGWLRGLFPADESVTAELARIARAPLPADAAAVHHHGG